MAILISRLADNVTPDPTGLPRQPRLISCIRVLFAMLKSAGYVPALANAASRSPATRIQIARLALEGQRSAKLASLAGQATPISRAG